jgi:hypothetical protein
MLILNFLLVASLVIVQSDVIDHASSQSRFGFFQMVALSLAAYLVLRTLLVYLLAWVFPFGGELRFFQFNLLNAVKIAGLILYPLLLVLWFAPEPLNRIAFYAAVCIVLSGFLWLVFKGFAIAKSYWLGYPLHFMLYLCALEIAPVLMLSKLISIWVV